MPISFKIEKKGKKFDMIQDAVMKLHGQGTEIGYFGSQGKHKGADGIADYSYAALANALETGFFPNAERKYRRPMPFMEHIMQRTAYGMARSRKVNTAFRLWGRKLDKRGNPLVLLDAVGEYAVQQSKQVFNNPAYFPQNPKNKTPLVTTGELRSKFTYRTTFDNKVRRT